MPTSTNNLSPGTRAFECTIASAEPKVMSEQGVIIGGQIKRTLMSICTGSLFLAEQGILSGLSATTHPDYMTKFENLCSHAAQRDLQERTDVIEDARYVVNNLRFDLGDEDENPYIRRKSDGTDRRPSNARYVHTDKHIHLLKNTCFVLICLSL